MKIVYAIVFLFAGFMVINTCLAMISSTSDMEMGAGLLIGLLTIVVIARGLGILFKTKEIRLDDAERQNREDVEGSSREGEEGERGEGNELRGENESREGRGRTERTTMEKTND